MKIAIIDIRNARRARLVNLLSRIDSNAVFDFASISRSEFENGGFEVALVHENNSEGDLLVNEAWDSKGMGMIFFSGGNSEPISREDDFLFVSEAELFNRLPDLESMLGFEQ
jgi:hypothetical protein